MKIKIVVRDYDEVMAMEIPKHFKPVKPNLFWRTVTKVASQPALWQTHFTHKEVGMEKLGKDEPALILMNHSSFLDFEIAYSMLFPRKFNTVATLDSFVGDLGPLMKQIGCFPTRKFIADLQLIRDIKHCLFENKCSVLMFPEAAYSFDGTKTTMPATVAGLIKRLGVPFVMIETLDALEGKEHHCAFDGIDTVLCDEGQYCAAPITHKVTLGQIVDLLDNFKAQPDTLVMPEIPHGSFAKKLYSTYLSYLPKEKVSFPLKMNEDARGSFTELLKTEKCGQFSVNISKPGITKGQHWHHTKWEFFIVVSGKGLIQQRKIGTDEVLNFEVSGEKIEAVHMLPGYTHNIINLSETENLVTVMWANEQFEPNHPDTFFEVVE